MRMVETPTVVRWKGDLVHRARCHPGYVDSLERSIVCEGRRETRHVIEDGSPATCLWCAAGRLY